MRGVAAILFAQGAQNVCRPWGKGSMAIVETQGQRVGLQRGLSGRRASSFRPALRQAQVVLPGEVIVVDGGVRFRASDAQAALGEILEYGRCGGEYFYLPCRCGHDALAAGQCRFKVGSCMRCVRMRCIQRQQCMLEGAFDHGRIAMVYDGGTRGLVQGHTEHVPH